MLALWGYSWGLRGMVKDLHFEDSKAYLELCLFHLYSQFSIQYTNKEWAEAKMLRVFFPY